MAAPTDSARQGTNITTAATSHAINVGSPAADTLLIVFVRFAAAPGTVTFTGYTLFAIDFSDASDDDTRLYYRWADGTEGATDTLSTVNSVKLAAICWEITGAANPATKPPSVSVVGVGTAANINPPNTPLLVNPLNYLEAGSGAAFTLGHSSPNTRRAESFVATGAVQRVAVQALKVGSPADNLIIEIQTDSGGAPSGTVVGSSISFSGATLLSVTHLLLCEVAAATTSGLTYWIVARRSGAVDTGAYYQLRGLDDGSTYAGGVHKDFDGSNWNAVTNDLRFATYETATAADDCLFITVLGLDSETATATAPSGYSSTQAANSGTGGAVATNCMIWGASKQATSVTSDDPAAWTSSAPNSGVTAWTIAIPAPAPSGTAHTANPADTLGLSDAQAISQGQAAADTLSLVDLLSRVTGVTRAPADTVALTDATTRAKTIPVAIDDTVGLTDNAAAVRGLNLSIPDSVVLADARAQTFGDVIADAVALADNLARTVAYARSVLDTVTLADEATTDHETAGADHTRDIDDTVALTDALVDALGLARTLQDTLTLTDNVQALIVLTRTIDDTVALTDSLARVVAISRTIADTVTLADQLTRVTASSRTVLDTVALTDTFTRATTTARTLADTLTLADQIVTTIGLSVPLADTVTLADDPQISHTISTPWAVPVADQVSLTDLLAPVLILGGVITGGIDRSRVGSLGTDGTGRIDTTDDDRIDTADIGNTNNILVGSVN